MYRHITIAKLKPGELDTVSAAARRLIDAARREPGCISYNLLIPENGQDTIILLEDWTDRVCFEQHIKAPSTSAFGAVCDPRCASAPVFIPANQVY